MDKNTQDLFDELHAILDGYADINALGGPNRAMSGLNVLEELRGRYESLLEDARAMERSFDKAWNERGL